MKKSAKPQKPRSARSTSPGSNKCHSLLISVLSWTAKEPWARSIMVPVANENRATIRITGKEHPGLAFLDWGQAA